MLAQVATVWNSLEVVKLIVGVLTPLSVVGFGFWVNQRLKRFEHLQWANQKVIEKRLTVYEEVAPLLNDLLCYFTYIGCWKDLIPPDMVQLKRRMDRIVFVNAPLFPPEFLGKYNFFVDLCYGTYAGWGRDAPLRTQSGRRRQVAGNNWKSEWDECFAQESEATDPKAIRTAYGELMAFMASGLGIGVRAEPLSTGEVPYNIH